jgi:hypothetical protein
MGILAFQQSYYFNSVEYVLFERIILSHVYNKAVCLTFPELGSNADNLN